MRFWVSPKFLQINSINYRFASLVCGTCVLPKSWKGWIPYITQKKVGLFQPRCWAHLCWDITLVSIVIYPLLTWKLTIAMTIIYFYDMESPQNPFYPSGSGTKCLAPPLRSCVRCHSSVIPGWCQRWTMRRGRASDDPILASWLWKFLENPGQIGDFQLGLLGFLEGNH